jgi:hypothetical protein
MYPSGKLCCALATEATSNSATANNSAFFIPISPYVAFQFNLSKSPYRKGRVVVLSSTLVTGFLLYSPPPF